MYAVNSCDESDEDNIMSGTVSNEALKDSCEIINRSFEEEHFNLSPAEERSSYSMATTGIKGYFASWECKYFIRKNISQSLICIYQSLSTTTGS